MTLPPSRAQSMTVDAVVTLPHENSLVRIVVVDSEGVDHLLSENYPLISGTGTTTITDACEETCYASFTPKELKVIVEDASVTITQLTIAPATTGAKTSETGTQAMYATAQIRESKIDKINRRLQEQGLRWTAGETSVSQLSYEEKKRLFADTEGNVPEDLPNLGGFEYYTGGIFELSGATTEPTTAATAAEESALPAEWDWRNVHGENWMTSIKNQGSAGTCWAHAMMGTMESQINLYYNQHANPDLSEQMLDDCTNPGENTELSGWPELCTMDNLETGCYYNPWYCKTKVLGISEESCDPYAERDNVHNPGMTNSCDSAHICADWKDRMWVADDFYQYTPYEVFTDRTCSRYSPAIMTNQEIKKALIEKGPLDAAILSWNHAMVLVGYGGNSNWEVTRNCADNGGFCVPGEGCVPQTCTVLGETKTACINSHGGIATYFDNENGQNDVGFAYKMIYNCTTKDQFGNELYEPQWVIQNEYQSCGMNDVCIAGECRPKTEYHPGMEVECTPPAWGRSNEMMEYRPGNGDPYWIYKNSWGTGYGENGYVRVSVSMRNMGWAMITTGPYTPPKNQAYWPAGFDNSIKCVDKDNDNYCNWGITTDMPSTCPASCEPEKDCNDANPLMGAFDENLNCQPIAPRMPVTHSVNGKRLTLNYNGTAPYAIRIGATSGTANGGYAWIATGRNTFSIDTAYAINPNKKFYYTVIDAAGKQGRGAVTID